MALLVCPTCHQKVDVETKAAVVDDGRGFRVSHYIYGFDQAKCVSQDVYERDSVFICPDLCDEAGRY